MTWLHVFGIFFLLAVVLPAVLSMVAEDLQCRAAAKRERR